MSALLLVVLAGVDAPQVMSAGDAPRVTVYGYPVATAAMLGRGAIAGEWAIDLPFGVSVRLNEQTSLDFEAMWMGLGASTDTSLHGFAVSFAAGPKFSLWRGLWVDAHARFSLYHPLMSAVIRCPPDVLCAFDHGPGDLGPGWTRAFLAEADVGYEWRFGALYLSLVLGIGGGYAYDCLDSTGMRLLSPFAARTTAGRRTEGFVWTLNLNLLRIGVSL
jgi:hypothetical protein